MAEIRHLVSWRQTATTRFSQKLNNLELWCLLTTCRSYVSLTGLFKEPIIRSLQSKMADIRRLENRHGVIFFCQPWSDLDKISQTGTEWHLDCGDVWKWKPDVEFQYDGCLGEFNGMSSQSHVSHCRVLPLGEFTVTIPEPHATLQGVRIPSAILKIVFLRYFILFYCF